MRSFRRCFKGLVFVAALFVSLTSVAADWPQWRGPNRDGNVTGAVIPEVWPKALKEEWKTVVGVGHASPVESGGRIYIFARQGEEEVLLCLDALTGKEIWRSSQPVAYQMNPAATGHGKGPKSTPVVSNGTVFTFGISGIISAHDARTGKLKWRREFSKEYKDTSPYYGTAMSPLVDNGLLIAHVGGHDKGALTAFDAETGAVKWSNNTDGPAYASPIIVTLAGVRQIVTTMQKEFAGVDLGTGKLLWTLPAKSEWETNSVTPVAYKDMVVLSREGQGLTAVRLVKEGSEFKPQEVWNNKEIDLYMNTPVLQGNLLFGLSVRQKGQFFAIDADTGKSVWLGPGRMGENAAILNLDGKALLFLTNEANLIVQPATAKGYSPVAQYSVASTQTWAHPLVLGRRILIKDETSLISLSTASR
jgi:outer membrane protein assembly factor BamB